jgi:hypothetical protein
MWDELPQRFSGHAVLRSALSTRLALRQAGLIASLFALAELLPWNCVNLISVAPGDRLAA